MAYFFTGTQIHWHTVVAQMGTDLGIAAQLLQSGNLVAIPTETVYGLAANALDISAVIKIFEAKNRPAFDPLIVHVHSAHEFEKYAQNIPLAALDLAEKVCPGPITFILKKQKNIPDLVSSGHPTVGLRVPNHPLTLALLADLEFPLAAPSANPFGFTSPTTAQHVQQQLGQKIDYILDGGPCAVGLESTIIDFSVAQPKVLRLGGFSIEHLQELLGQDLAVQTSSSNPKAPGMLSAHYNPGKKIILFTSIENLNLSEFKNQKIGILAFQNYHPEIDRKWQRILSPTGNLAEAAQGFFAALREFNRLEVTIVFAQILPEIGLGRAINDRLRRAAAK